MSKRTLLTLLFTFVLALSLTFAQDQVKKDTKEVAKKECCSKADNKCGDKCKADHKCDGKCKTDKKECCKADKKDCCKADKKDCCKDGKKDAHKCGDACKDGCTMKKEAAAKKDCTSDCKKDCADKKAEVKK